MLKNSSQTIANLTAFSVFTTVCFSNQALAQDPPAETPPAESKAEIPKDADPAPAMPSQPAQAPAEGNREAPGAVVEGQKGCRISIKGLPATKIKSPVLLKKQDGTILSASVAASSNGKTTAMLTGASCKQNVKGWIAELQVDPNSAPIQVGAPLIFEPGTSGWHRAKRPGSFVFGLGAGYQIPSAPMYGLQFGYSYPQLALMFNYDLGVSGGSGITVSGTRSTNFLIFSGNSLFFDVGLGSEVRGATFNPKRVVNGEIRDALMATGKSEITFIHYGIGNKWQWGGFGISVEWLGFRGAISRTDEVDVSDVVVTTQTDGTVTSESKKITDEASVALNKDIFRKKIGDGGSYRIMFTSFSYSF